MCMYRVVLELYFLYVEKLEDNNYQIICIISFCVEGEKKKKREN